MRTLLAALACSTALLAANPAAAQPAAARPVAMLEFRDHAAPVPEGWEPQAPGSSFRVAQFRVPAAPGATAAEAVAFFFGQGQGGTPAANAARWASQFKRADGGPVEPITQALSVAGLAVTLVELQGSYARGIGGAAGVAAKPDQTLLAAVIETPHGNLTLQLHGDRATVEQHRAGFMALVRGFRQR